MLREAPLTSIRVFLGLFFFEILFLKRSVYYEAFYRTDSAGMLMLKGDSVCIFSVFLPAEMRKEVKLVVIVRFVWEVTGCSMDFEAFRLIWMIDEVC